MGKIFNYQHLLVYIMKDLPFNLPSFPFPVLLKFRTDKGRDPSSDTFGEDSELLLQIRNDVLESLGVSPDLLPEDFVRLVSVFLTGQPGLINYLLFTVCLNLGRSFRTKALRRASLAAGCRLCSHRPLPLRCYGPSV